MKKKLVNGNLLHFMTINFILWNSSNQMVRIVYLVSHFGLQLINYVLSDIRIWKCVRYATCISVTAHLRKVTNNLYSCSSPWCEVQFVRKSFFFFGSQVQKMQWQQEVVTAVNFFHCEFFCEFLEQIHTVYKSFS